MVTMFMLVGFAEADSGVIEIHQACVATGCLTADQPGFPVTISQPGSYRLTSNIEVPADVTAIDIDATNVTFNLGGFAILGPVDCTGDAPTCSPDVDGYGIDTRTSHNLRIFNGTIQGMGANAIMGNSDVFVIRNMLISDTNGAGIRVTGQGTIESVTVRDSRLEGIISSYRFITRDSQFINNGSYGVSYGHCASNMFIYNGDGEGVDQENCHIHMTASYCTGMPC